MKKYLSIFMTAVMVLTMIPMMAFADTYPKAKLITGPLSYTNGETNKEIKLKVELGKNLDLKAGRVMFELDNAKLAKTPSPASAEVIHGTTSISSPAISFKNIEGNALTGGEKMFNFEVASDIPANNVDEMDIIITLKLDFSDTGNGNVNLRFTDYGVGFGDSPLNLGTTQSAVTEYFEARVDRPETAIGPAGGLLSTVLIQKFNGLSSTKSENEIVVSLTSGYLFSASSKIVSPGYTPNVSYSNDKTEMYIKGIDSNTAYIAIEPFVILEATNSAKSGTISANFSLKVKDKTVQSKDAVLGKLQSYGLTLTAKEQNAREIPTLSKGQSKTVELTIKAVDGTLTNGATIKLDVKNAEIVYNSIKVTEPAGMILTAPKSAGSNNKVSGYEVYKDSEFTLRTHKYDVQNIKLTFDIVAEDQAKTNATVTASVDKLDDVTIDIAKISKVLDIETKPARVEKGKIAELPQVVLKETKVAQLQRGDKIYLELIYPGSDKDKGQHIAFDKDSVKDIKATTTNSLKIDSIELDKQENILVLTIGSRSYDNAGTITLSNIKGYLTEKAVTDRVDVLVTLNITTETSAAYFWVNNPVALRTVFVINNLSYTSNGVIKQLNTAPYIKDGRTMLPVRAVGESLGLEASWDNTTKTATFKNAEKTAVVKIGSSTITVNNTPVALTAPAEIKNGSTMIELRSLATAFGVDISWNAATKSVSVN